MNINHTHNSPLHDQIEQDVVEMKLDAEEAQTYRDLIWHYVNVNRWTFGVACATAMQNIVLQFPKTKTAN